MNKSLCLLLVLGLLLFAGLGTVTAQESEPVLVELSDDYVLQVPEGWEGREGINDGFIISDGTCFLYVMDPTVVAEKVELDELPLIQDVLAELFQIQYRAQVPAEDITTTTFGELPAAVYSYAVGGSFGGTFVVVMYDEGQYALFDLTAPLDDGEDPLTFLESVVQTLGQGEPEPMVVQATVVPCLVRGARPNDVPVRIGPGENRAIILYFPADTEVRANGYFLDTEGGEWLRVLKTQLAPNVAADELWVARTDLTETGDCDALTSIATRNIIPAAPPVTVISQPAGSASAGGTGAGDPSAQVGTVPRGGSWTFTFDPTALQSCLNGDTTQSNTTDILGDFGRGFTGGMNVAADGRSFTYYGNTYGLNTDGDYVSQSSGSDSSGNQTGTVIRLTPLSPTQMTGTYTINVRGVDFQCSISIYVSVRRG